MMTPAPPVSLFQAHHYSSPHGLALNAALHIFYQYYNQTKSRIEQPLTSLFNVQQRLTGRDRVALLDCKRKDLLTHRIVARRDPDRGLHSFQLNNALVVVLDHVAGLGVEFPHVGREGRDNGSADPRGCLACNVSQGEVREVALWGRGEQVDAPLDTLSASAFSSAAFSARYAWNSCSSL